MAGSPARARAGRGAGSRTAGFAADGGEMGRLQFCEVIAFGYHAHSSEVLGNAVIRGHVDPVQILWSTFCWSGGRQQGHPEMKGSKMFHQKCPHCKNRLGDFLYADRCPRCKEVLTHFQANLAPAAKVVAARSWPVVAFLRIVRIIES